MTNQDKIINISNQQEIYSYDYLQELLDEYAPIFCLHEEEDFLPIKIECYLTRSVFVEDPNTLEKNHTLTPTPSGVSESELLRGKKISILAAPDYIAGARRFEKRFRNKQKFLDYQRQYIGNSKINHVIYGHYHYHNEHLTLTYYAFFLGNDLHFRRDDPFYSHDCDWEMVRIFFEIKGNEWGPMSVYFAQHNYGKDPEIPWEKLTNSNYMFGNHLMVRLTLGGHASYPPPENIDRSTTDSSPRRQYILTRWISTLARSFKPNERLNIKPDVKDYPILPKKINPDHLEDFPYRKDLSYKLIKLKTPMLSEKSPWLNYKGKWGEGYYPYSDAPFGPRHFTGEMREFHFVKDMEVRKRNPRYWFEQGGTQQSYGDLGNAEIAFLKSLDLSDDLELDYDVCVKLGKIKINQKYQDHWKEAENYFMNSMDIAKKLDDKRKIGLSYFMVGNMKDVQEINTEAIDYYFKAIELLETSESYVELAIVYYNLNVISKRLSSKDSLKEKLLGPLEYALKSASLRPLQENLPVEENITFKVWNYIALELLESHRFLIAAEEAIWQALMDMPIDDIVLFTMARIYNKFPTSESQEYPPNWDLVSSIISDSDWEKNKNGLTESITNSQFAENCIWSHLICSSRSNRPPNPLFFNELYISIKNQNDPTKKDELEYIKLLIEDPFDPLLWNSLGEKMKTRLYTEEKGYNNTVGKVLTGIQSSVNGNIVGIHLSISDLVLQDILIQIYRFSGELSREVGDNFLQTIDNLPGWRNLLAIYEELKYPPEYINYVEQKIQALT